jgi:hypothetical protein
LFQQIQRTRGPYVLFARYLTQKVRVVDFLATMGSLIPSRCMGRSDLNPQLLEQFDYGDVVLAGDLHNQQLEQTHSVLMGLSDDSLLKPFRQMSGQPAPGEDLGGWYHYDTHYKSGQENNVGFAPSCTFGQWVSARAHVCDPKRSGNA